MLNSLSITAIDYVDVIKVLLVLSSPYALLPVIYLFLLRPRYKQGVPGSPAYYYEERNFSIINIGIYVPDSAIDPNSFGIWFVQAFYFLLAVVTPLQNVVVFSLLYLLPMKDWTQRWIFFLSEITFAWEAVEVMMVSAIFLVKQIPNFGSRIVDSGCSTC